MTIPTHRVISPRDEPHLRLVSLCHFKELDQTPAISYFLAQHLKSIPSLNRGQLPELGLSFKGVQSSRRSTLLGIERLVSLIHCCDLGLCLVVRQRIHVDLRALLLRDQADPRDALRSSE